MRLFGFALTRVRRDWQRSGVMVASLVLAVASFIVLTANVETSTLRTIGTVADNSRSSYDILVRPSGSQTQVERQQSLVRPNYLSGIFGGISLAQVAAVKAVDGVQVAAPIAMIGQVLQTVSVPVDVTSYVSGAGPAALRFTSSMVSRNGSAQVPGPAGYVYVTPAQLTWEPQSGPPEEPFGAKDATLPGRLSMSPAQVDVFPSPFAPQAQWETSCWSRASGDPNGRWSSLGAGKFAATVRWSFPVTIAAVDPAAEAALTGVDATMSQGRYLTSEDQPVRLTGQQEGWVTVPVIASSRPEVDERMDLQIEQLSPEAARQIATADSFEQGRTTALAAAGTPQGTVSVEASQVLSQWLATLNSGSRPVDGYWTGTPVSYTRTQGPLSATVVTNPDSVWRSGFQGQGGFVAVPQDASRPGFRQLTGHPVIGSATNVESLAVPQLKLIGAFDPQKLPNYSPLSEVPLETYRAPEAQPVDDATKTALQGRPLRPDLNPAGYLQAPPYLLTTLSSLSAFSNPSSFQGVRNADNPISVIRVRVNDVTSTDAVSRERVRLVAERIQKATGLDVDITLGSSPAPTTVSIPTGQTPSALVISEKWVKKGVATIIVDAVDRKSLLLFFLVLVASALTVSVTANASVRARRTELGVLSCLGWTSGSLARGVLAELTALGLAAGVTGALLAWPVATALDVPITWTRALIAVPAAVALCLLAGLVPAIKAARAKPIEAVESTTEIHGKRSAHGVVSMAWVAVRRAPGRAACGVAAIALGTASLTILLGIVAGFRGAIVGTLLGDAVTVQVRTPDLVAAALIGVLGLVALADILLLDVREQSSTYALLQATGWGDGPLSRLVLVQSVIIAAGGVLLGGGAGLLAISRLGELTAPVISVAALIAAAMVAAAALVATWPAAYLRRLPTAVVLSQE